MPTTRLALLPSLDEPVCDVPPEELDQRRNAALLGRPRDVGGGIDAEHRDVRPEEVLEEVAVVRRKLDDEIVVTELQALADRLHVATSVLDPRRGIGGEVRVLREDLLGSDELGDLHEPTPRACPGVERIEALHGVERVRSHEGLARRRHAQVDDSQFERRLAEATSRTARHRLILPDSVIQSVVSDTRRAR